MKGTIRGVENEVLRTRTMRKKPSWEDSDVPCPVNPKGPSSFLDYTGRPPLLPVVSGEDSQSE